MAELLAKFDAGEFIGLVAVVGGILCGLLGIVMGVWHTHRKTEIEAALKQDMLNRGMSAEEIRTILDAGTAASQGGCRRDRVARV
jgi:hypothetical protein